MRQIAVLTVVLALGVLVAPVGAQVSLRDAPEEGSAITVGELAQLVVEMFVYPPDRAPSMATNEAFELMLSMEMGSYAWDVDDLLTQAMLAEVAGQVGADYQAGDPDAVVSYDYAVKVLMSHKAKLRKYVSAYVPKHGSGSDAFGELYEDAPTGAVSVIDF
jgi:hypothetical protein